MAHDDPIPYRLREALRMRGRTANSLQVQLARSGVPGSSSASVNRYVHGTVEAPVRFLQAAARELGVSELWLISGYGSADPEAPAVEVAGRVGPGPAAEREERIIRRIADRFHSFARMSEGPRLVVRDVCLRMADNAAGAGSDLECADRVAAVLQAPLEVLGLDGEGPAPDPERLEAYAIATAQALAWLLPVDEAGLNEGDLGTGGGRKRRSGSKEAVS